MKLLDRRWGGLAKNIALTVVGTLVLAFGTAVFILPMNIVGGGVSGMAIVLAMALPFEAISVELIVFVLTWMLFFVGLFTLGRAFAIKTLISSLIYPVAVSAFLRLCSPDLLGGFFYLEGYGHRDLVLILAASVGGAFVGLGCALAFIGGGSTGGIDVIAFSICKLFTRIKSSAVIFFIDTLTIILGMLVMRDLVLSLLGILSAFVSALMVDKVFLGGQAAFVAYAVTDNPQNIGREIIERLNRTTTELDAVGGFSGRKKKMLMVSFTVSQYAELLNIISKNDPSTFVIVHRAHEINGEGWDRRADKADK